MNKNFLKPFVEPEKTLSPEEENYFCPMCNSPNVIIEKWVERYPYLRCLKCNVAFYPLQLRSACTKWKKSVTVNQCKSCFYFHPYSQCKYWNGVLPPPKELAKAIKEFQSKQQNSY